MIRKVYLEDLPKWEVGGNKGRIDWNKSIGNKIKFLYNDLTGYIEILDYDKDRQRLKVKYNNNIHSIKTGHLSKGSIGNILGMINRDYVYNLNQIIRVSTGNIKILEKISIKNSKEHNVRAYKYKCLNDGYIGKISEPDLNNKHGCPVCCNRTIIKGVNDIGTTHPYLITFFVNAEDVHRNSYGSRKDILMRCPNCKLEKKQEINTLVTRGFSCRKCGDGISYPEKFLYNFLDQLTVEFEIQKVFDWSNNKQYDFYLPKFNLIIETHGLQHYENNYSFSKNINLKDIQDNDYYKRELAINHNLNNYIVLDCRKWEGNWIKNNIESSELASVFDLSKIDWPKCQLFACSSRVKEASDLWNNYSKDTKLISKRMKLSRQTTIKYLKQGKEVGWCNYDPRMNMAENCRINSKKRQIPIIMYGKDEKILGFFESATELSNVSVEKFGIKLSQTAISSVCIGKSSHHKGYKFKFFA